VVDFSTTFPCFFFVFVVVWEESVDVPPGVLTVFDDWELVVLFFP
jgi:hypothetical protein